MKAILLLGLLALTSCGEYECKDMAPLVNIQNKAEIDQIQRQRQRIINEDLDRLKLHALTGGEHEFSSKVCNALCKVVKNKDFYSIKMSILGTFSLHHVIACRCEGNTDTHKVIDIH